MSQIPIPLIREYLHDLAATLRGPDPDARFGIADKIDFMAEATRRDYGGRRAPRTAAPVDGPTVEAVKAIARARPRAPFRKIAQAMDTDGGRVSEILAGKHDDKLA